MKFKFIIFAVLIGLCSDLSAQKVKRKGVKPLKVRGTSTNQPKYTLAQVAGKWQEVRRTKTGSNESISFIDTLQLAITKNTVKVRDGIHLSITGEVYIDPPNSAKLAGDVYTIESLDNNSFVLNDGELVHYLEKRNSFYYESLTQQTIKPESFTDPIEPDQSKLKGKWSVYRRDALPGVAHDDDIISYVDIKERNSDSSYTGEVGFYSKQISQTSPCKITFKNKEIHIVSDKGSWVEPIYKADGNEFVFGDKNDILYFAKKL